MKNLINNKKKILVLILIFIVILFTFYKIAQSRDLKVQEDLIFFKLLGNGNIEEQDIEQENYRNNNFENSYQVKVFKDKKSYEKVNLLQTINLNTLVNEKVAPGTSGSFYVDLISDSDLQYELEIVNKNEKPKNFEFEIEEKEGRIEKNKIKKVRINWKWLYEINEEEDIQDTKDGETLEKFNFEIQATAIPLALDNR